MVRSQSIIAIPPGATIKEQLTGRGMSQKEFAARMDMSEKHISKLVNGEVRLTPEVSVRLETVLGVPARFWNNLEAIYREKLIKIEEDAAMERDLEIASLFPYAEMAKLGWVPDTKIKTERVINLRRFFEVVQLSLLDNSKITRVACRRLAITEKSDLALIAWIQKAKINAREIQTSSFSIRTLMRKIPEIRKMTVSKPQVFFPLMEKELSDCGVALVLLPHLQGSFLQGASFIDGNKVVIGLTTRGKDADKFWFSLFHELGHIILGHVENDCGTTEAQESSADRWSANTLIDKDDFDYFKSNWNHTEDGIIRFAEEEEIAPGIVVGRMQAEKIIKYSEFNYLKEQYILA